MVGMNNFTIESKERLRQGSLKAAAISRTKSKNYEDHYNEDPKLCQCCKNPLSYQRRRNKFCGSSCAAIINNTLYPKRGVGSKLCLNCGELLFRKDGRYCNSQCQQDYHQDIWVQKWLTGEITGGGMSPSPRIKRYLRSVQEDTCAICGLDTWMGAKIGLILDHINGDSTNHSVINVRLVCGNCDEQLPTYKSKNKGNGRASRRQRYHDGKSY